MSNAAELFAICRQALQSANVRAFLRVIRSCEGTPDEAGYRRHFGGELFDSFAAHPNKHVTKPLGGRTITSTAAGAYQFLAGTWAECQKALELPDQIMFDATENIFTASGGAFTVQYAVIGVSAGKALAWCKLSTAAIGITAGNTLKITPSATGFFTLTGGSTA